MNYNQSATPYNTFASNKYIDETRDFLKSNSVVAEIAFVLLVCVVFVILLRIGVSILNYLLSPTKSPKLITGMVDAKQFAVFPQDPSLANSKTIMRSVNQNDGIEFTWSVWLFIDNLDYNSGKYKCVFYKGNDYASSANTASAASAQGLNFPNNAPGMYIAPNTNDLVIFMNTFNVINEEVTISDVPMNKWFNVMIRCENTTLDVYVNGTITKSHKLHGVPKQNYGDVYVAMNGGFSGYISNLWYYNHALDIAEIQRLVNRGPNTNMTGTSSLTIKDPNYLSLRWFFGEN
jgi:hypothetical protein